jgi:hypothetical protein
MPVGNGRFVALPRTACRLLETPLDGLEEPADVGWMVPNAICQVNYEGNAHASPELAAKAVGFGSLLQEFGQAGQQVDRQAAGDARRGTMLEGRWTLCAGPLHPLADSGFADAPGLGDPALGPAALQEFPRLEMSGFFPVVR